MALKRWARQHDRCVDCGTSKKPHHGRGRCKLCFDRWWQRENEEYYSEYRRQYSREKWAREKSKKGA